MRTRKSEVCDLFNRQIKHRLWPHKHSDKGTRSERGKQDSFAFGCIVLNTFNTYRDIIEIATIDYDYYSCCEQLADDLYTYALNLSDGLL